MCMRMRANNDLETSARKSLTQSPEKKGLPYLVDIENIQKYQEYRIQKIYGRALEQVGFLTKIKYEKAG